MQTFFYPIKSDLSRTNAKLGMKRLSEEQAQGDTGIGRNASSSSHSSVSTVQPSELSSAESMLPFTKADILGPQQIMTTDAHGYHPQNSRSMATAAAAAVFSVKPRVTSASEALWGAHPASLQQSHQVQQQQQPHSPQLPTQQQKSKPVKESAKQRLFGKSSKLLTGLSSGNMQKRSSSSTSDMATSASRAQSIASPLIWSDGKAANKSSSSSGHAFSDNVTMSPGAVAAVASYRQHVFGNVSGSTTTSNSTIRKNSMSALLAPSHAVSTTSNKLSQAVSNGAHTISSHVSSSPSLSKDHHPTVSSATSSHHTSHRPHHNHGSSKQQSGQSSHIGRLTTSLYSSALPVNSPPTPSFLKLTKTLSGIDVKQGSGSNSNINNGADGNGGVMSIDDADHGTMTEDVWPAICSIVFGLFMGEGLRTPVEDMNNLVQLYLTSTAAVDISGIARAALTELLENGMQMLGYSATNLSDEKAIDRLVEVWSFFYGTILPYLEAVFLPFQLDESVRVDPRRLSIIAFRDIIVFTYQNRLGGR